MGLYLPRDSGCGHVPLGVHPAGILDTTSGGWSPLNLPNLVAWYDASSASHVVLNGSNVSQLTDLSGNGNHATQSTAGNQPAYVQDGSGLNALNYINFATGKGFTHSITTAFAGSTVAMVSGTTSSTAYRGLFCSGSGGIAVYDRLGGTNWGTFMTSPGDIPSGSVLVGSVKTHMMVNRATNDFDFWTENTKVNKTNGVTLWTVGNQFFGAGGGGLSSENLVGSFYEFVLCSSALGSTDQATLNTYLQGKYGV